MRSNFVHLDEAPVHCCERNVFGLPFFTFNLELLIGHQTYLSDIRYVWRRKEKVLGTF